MTTPLVTAVIFDRDGVLTSFDQDAAAAYFTPLLPISQTELLNRWLAWGAQVGYPRSLSEEASFFNGFWNQICDDMHLSNVVRAELCALDYTQFVRPFPDARPALEAARRAGLRIGVLSNFSLASLEQSLAAAGLADVVDVACAATVIGTAKPEPAAYHTILRALDVDAANTLFFDDEQLCVDGATACGLRAYLVDRSSGGTYDSGTIPNLTVLARLLSTLPHAGTRVRA